MRSIARGWIAVLAASACSAPSRPARVPSTPPRANPPPRAAPLPRPAQASRPPPPEVELVVAGDDPAATDDAARSTVRFVKTAASGLVVTRTVEVPGDIMALAWVGADPVVMLADGQVGRIAGGRYASFPAVPSARWAVPNPHVDADPGRGPTERFDTPRWELIVDTAGAVWQARCDWGWDLPHGVAHHCVEEGGDCDAWVYARISPGPLEIARREPSSIAFEVMTFGGYSSDDDHNGVKPSWPVPEVAPSTAIQAAIVSAGTDPRDVLRCTAAGKTIQYPTDDDRDERQPDGDGVSQLTWLSTDPPIFAVSRRFGCRDTGWIAFEGCSQADLADQIYGGPKDLIAATIGNTQLALYWHGRALGTLDGVTRFAFAPSR